jgi:hypothetical protein
MGIFKSTDAQKQPRTLLKVRIGGVSCNQLQRIPQKAVYTSDSTDAVLTHVASETQVICLYLAFSTIWPPPKLRKRRANAVKFYTSLTPFYIDEQRFP